MRSIEHEAIHFCFVGKFGGVLRKDRQLRMQRSYRYGRKGKQVHPQVSERRQQFVRFSRIVSYGCREVVDASYMKCHSCLDEVMGPVSWASVAGEQVRTFIIGDDVVEAVENPQNSLSPPRVAVERRVFIAGNPPPGTQLPLPRLAALRTPSRPT